MVAPELVTDGVPRGPIVVFVAMPYTDLGDKAKWKKPQLVEKFYENVRREISKKTGRDVELRIEKYSAESGLVIDKMFKAIRGAEVFIADLTGSNANVFLELGIRYGVSNGVTILTTQEDGTPPFDLNQMRIVRYANGPTQDAEEQIAKIVFEELDTKVRGSPVLNMLDVEVVDRKQWEHLAGRRVQLLLEKSKHTTNAEERLKCVQEALDVDPLSEVAHLEMARVRRTRGEFDVALRATDDAIKLFSTSAQLHKERGTILDRMTARGENRLDDAIAACALAIQLNKNDADLHACLGGVLRRKGMQASGAARGPYFERALEHYRTSLALERHSTYAGLNVLRLQMLMSGSAQGTIDQLRDYLKRMYHLCAFEVADSHIRSEDGRWWKLFDLGDVFTFMNERERAIETYRKAISTIPDALRADVLISPLRSWKELLTSGGLDKEVSHSAEDILNLLEGQSQAASD